MINVKQIVLMLCLFLSGALVNANGVTKTQKERGTGTPIEIIEKVLHQSSDRSDSILASIDGHLLTVTFTENLGDVQVEITTASGDPVDYHRFFTPGGYLAYITYTGSYVVTITLENGDEYYGEFEVSD